MKYVSIYQSVVVLALFRAITLLSFFDEPECEALFLDSRSEQRVSVSPRFKTRCLNLQRMFSANQGFRMISI